MADSDYKTFKQWNDLGYMIPRKEDGGSATHYLVSPDGQHRLPVWTEDQVIKLTDTWKLTTKEDLPPLPGSKVKGKRVRYRYENGRMYVWVGPHEDMRDLLKKYGYRYKPNQQMRWVKECSAAQRDAFIAAAEKRKYLVFNDDEAL